MRVTTVAWVLLTAIGLLLLGAPAGAKNPPRPRKKAVEPPSPDAVLPASEWTKYEAFELANAGALAAGFDSWSECVEKDKASLALEEQPHTLLHVAFCEARLGQYLGAFSDAQKALRSGRDRNDGQTVEAAEQRILDYSRHVSQVTFTLPPEISDVRLTLDGQPVTVEEAGKPVVAVEPGTHVVHADATLEGLPFTFEQTYECPAGELVVAGISPVVQKADFLTSDQLKCVLLAKEHKDVLKCLPASTTNLVVRAAMEVGGYSDTENVEVLSPQVNASVMSPTGGWNVGASYLVDVVSAASPDIVSEASPPFHEVRQAGTLTGGYKPGLYGAQATGHVSSEPDYLSVGGGVALTADLNDKLITPRVEYDFTHDTIGRGGTPFSVFHQTLLVHEVDVGVALVLSASSLLLINGTLQLERGDQSKPYRYVPIFAPSVAPFIPVGASVSLVNQVRLPVRSLEQLPDSRDRYALSARFAHRFKTSTLRLEERLYRDSWEQMATTTDLQYMIDIGPRWMVWPHLRFNAQNGANFYQLAYTAQVPTTVGSPLVLPAYRTTDRDLSPLYTGTLGAGLRVGLSPAKAATQYGLSLQADSMFTHYLDALFVTNRTALFGTIGLDGEFQ